MEISIEDDGKILGRLSLAWWNTSLSPRGKARENNIENQMIAGEAILLMLLDKKIKFLIDGAQS
ncbi:MULTISPECIES: hypothetical protein [unclassified Pseudoalteromonas]|uniref:hypothetical protein n=1 Tax=unclassified Pseudoalteromonas TaxID=194690 RepID=UPI00390CB294|nr:hypothetical protein [Ningiella sp. W23]